MRVDLCLRDFESALHAFLQFITKLLIVSFFFAVMDNPEATAVPTATEEPFLSVLDFILLGILLGGAAWWLLKNKKKEPPTTVKSYSIQ